MRLVRLLLLVLLACSLYAQQQPPSDAKPQAAPDTAKQDAAKKDAPQNADQRPPTQQEVPKVGHPVTALKDARKIYIEPMVNDLDQYIRAEFLKQMPGLVTIVLKPEDADAVMTGTGEWKKGTGAAVTGRLLGLHDTATGTVSLLSNDAVLWASEAGDRSLFLGAMKRGGERKVADRIVHNFKKALEQAK